MGGFKEEVVIVGTKFAIIFGVPIFLFITLPVLILNHIYSLNCYQYTYQASVQYCLSQDNIILIIAWSAPAFAMATSYVVGLMMYLLKV
ncbi:hypothetical protein Goe16_01560 [Bacillus phage vB_BsuM-Goe16]|nr:hypothetical protein Goe16_01560 [Bacillus phage vB_BsuM-Goe16]